MTLRIRIIKFLLNLNERVVLYPKLAAYYKTEIKDQDPVIIDVGANSGQTISFFLKNFPKAKIFAFEPNQRRFEYLTNKFRNFSSVKLYNKGISNRNGKQTFNEMVLDETSTFEKLNFNSNYLLKKAKILGIKAEELIAAEYEVDIITISNFLTGINLEKIDVLKIDTEGHEYKCLQGLFTNKSVKIDYIQLEHHRDDMYMDKTAYADIESILQQNYFFLHKKIKHGFGEIDELLFKRMN